MNEGQVYFIRSEGPGNPVKIGFSSNPGERLAKLQTGHPYPLTLLAAIPGGRYLESTLHKLFRRQRLTGEWFQCEGSMPAFLLGVMAAQKEWPS